MSIAELERKKTEIVAELERKKTEIVADHIRIYHDTKLSEAEKYILQELDWEIEILRGASNESNN